MIMASSGVRAPTCLCSSSPSSTAMKATIYNSLSASSTLTFYSKRTSGLHLYSLFPPKGLGRFSPWSGLKHLGLSVTWRSSKLERKKCGNRVAYASLFGVGAPEALVIGVVALLVFGPKGLAEVARSLGKTLRAFQPTIKELQEVSREFKSTLEKEIGLDEISSTTLRTENYNSSTTSTSSSVSSTQEPKIAADPNKTSLPNSAYTTEEYLKVTEEQLQAAAAQQQEQTSPQSENQLEAQAKSQEGLLSSGEVSSVENLRSAGQLPDVASSEVQEQGQTSLPEASAKETSS